MRCLVFMHGISRRECRCRNLKKSLKEEKIFRRKSTSLPCGQALCEWLVYVEDQLPCELEGR